MNTKICRNVPSCRSGCLVVPHKNTTTGAIFLIPRSTPQLWCTCHGPGPRVLVGVDSFDPGVHWAPDPSVQQQPLTSFFIHVERMSGTEAGRAAAAADPGSGGCGPGHASADPGSGGCGPGHASVDPGSGGCGTG